MSAKTAYTDVKDRYAVFDGEFQVQFIDHSRYERVGRVTCKETNDDVQCDVDINTEIFPVREKANLDICLLKNIKSDETLDDFFAHDQRVLGELLLD